jgi:uroporphyrinogen-III synthase
MRVLVTRPLNKSAHFVAALQTVDAEPVFLPCIEIQSIADPTLLDRAFAQLHCYDWMVLTSANAVQVLRDRFIALGIETLPENLRLAAVGPKTAASLHDLDLPTDFVPHEYTSAAILQGLGDLSGCWVLLPTADIADDLLPSAIQAAGGTAHVITAYHTLPATPDPHGVAELKEGVDVITFTSGSTVRNFVAIAYQAGLHPPDLPGNPKIACIGPRTAQVARDKGFKVHIVPDEYTTNGLVAAIHAA